MTFAGIARTQDTQGRESSVTVTLSFVLAALPFCPPCSCHPTRVPCSIFPFSLCQPPSNIFANVLSILRLVSSFLQRVASLSSSSTSLIALTELLCYFGFLFFAFPQFIRLLAEASLCGKTLVVQVFSKCLIHQKAGHVPGSIESFLFSLLLCVRILPPTSQLFENSSFLSRSRSGCLSVFTVFRDEGIVAPLLSSSRTKKTHHQH